MATLKSLVIKKRGKYLEVDSLLMSQVIQEGVEAGEFVAGDTQALALTILVAVGGLMPYSLSPAELTKRDEVARQTNEVLDLLLKGLACRLPGSSTRRSMDLSAPQMQSK
jgi:hypothetical protein